jgi:restriction system protein
MKYHSKRRQKQSGGFIYVESFLFIVLLLLSTKYIRIKPYSFVVIGSTVIFLAVIFAHISLKAWKQKCQKNYYLNSDIRKIDHMSGEEFELYLKAHFERKGYKVATTPMTNDQGADLILSRGAERIAVQAKRYKDKVGNKAIQEIAGALGYYKANKGMVVTNSFFTSSAKALASSNGIELWDRRKLIEVFQPPRT